MIPVNYLGKYYLLPAGCERATTLLIRHQQDNLLAAEINR
jgi:hypothetical protein